MFIKEITETTKVGDDLHLTTRQYRGIIKDLKRKQVGDQNVAKALRQIEDMWAKQDRLVGNYKRIIRDFDIDI